MTTPQRLGWLAGAMTLLAAFTVSCAQVGPVMAPSAGLPRPITDLQATRLGPTVYLQWTAPTTTSDGVRWAGPVQYALCAWPGVVAGSPPSPAPPAPPTPPQVPSPPPAPTGSNLTPDGRSMPACPRTVALSGTQVAANQLVTSANEATLALYASNAAGEGAGWSNLVHVILDPVSAPPQLDAVAAAPGGVQLRWTLPTPAPPHIEVYRNGPRLVQRLAQVSGATQQYLDTSVIWGQPYTYWLRSADATAKVESADSRHLSLTPRDTFPPDVPTGLEAIVAPAGAGVDLSWNSVTSANLAGYYVYRLDSASQAWVKLNPAPLPTPVFHDPAGAVNAQYRVASVSVAHVESKPGPPVSAH